METSSKLGAPWTADELTVLRSMAGRGYNAREIGAAIGRTWESVRAKAHIEAVRLHGPGHEARPECAGNPVYEARMYMRMTRRELADLLSVDPRSIGNWEAGRHYPHERAVYKALCEVLGVTLAELTGETVIDKGDRHHGDDEETA